MAELSKNSKLIEDELLKKLTGSCYNIIPFSLKS
jgi:hypothetical protein